VRDTTVRIGSASAFRNGDGERHADQRLEDHAVQLQVQVLRERDLKPCVK
jgi:hypothetical protein